MTKVPIRYLLLEIGFGALFAGFGWLLLMSGIGLWAFCILLFSLYVMTCLAIYDGAYGEVPDAIVISASIVIYLVLIIDAFWIEIFAYELPLSSVTLADGMMAAVILYFFFAIQNIIAGIVHLARTKSLKRLPGFIGSFLLLPAWWHVQLVAGDKFADRVLPGLDQYEDVPAWVGGGDMRYAVWLGMIAGIQHGIISIGIGYILGSFVAVYLILTGRRNAELPLIPYLASGWLVVYILTMGFGLMK